MNISFIKSTIIYINIYVKIIFFIIKVINNIIFSSYWGLGIGDWGLGLGDWPQSPIPNPQSPIPNPQSPISNPHIDINIIFIIYFNFIFLNHKIEYLNLIKNENSKLN